MRKGDSVGKEKKEGKRKGGEDEGGRGGREGGRRKACRGKGR